MIGKRGAVLEAIQYLTTPRRAPAPASRASTSPVDAEGYRARHEDQLARDGAEARAARGARGQGHHVRPDERARSPHRAHGAQGDHGRAHGEQRRGSGPARADHPGTTSPAGRRVEPASARATPSAFASSTRRCRSTRTSTGRRPTRGSRDILIKWRIGPRRAGGRARRIRGAVRDAAARERRDARCASAAPHLTWIGHATFVQRLGGKLVATDPILVPTHRTDQAPTRRRASRSTICRRSTSSRCRTRTTTTSTSPSLQALGRAARSTSCRATAARSCTRPGCRTSSSSAGGRRHATASSQITLVPAQHWSMRFPWDRNRRLWGGFVYEIARGRRRYHAGDTAFSERVFSRDRRALPEDRLGDAAHRRVRPASGSCSRSTWGRRRPGARGRSSARGTSSRCTGGRSSSRTSRSASRRSGMRAWWRDAGPRSARLWIFDVGETRDLRVDERAP